MDVAPANSEEKMELSTEQMEPKLTLPASSSSESPANPAASVSSPEPQLDRNDTNASSQNSLKDSASQSPATNSRSEEYRQLFRLPPDEVLIQDFNCAFQESILLQGHMYLFVHYICFYSNIFGFETKKIISFNEVTAVRRAKTAGIFPNAIEIVAGDKKYFFASFLSRDEAFKLITDGWVQHGNEAKEISSQDSRSESGRQENGLDIVDKVGSSRSLFEEVDFIERKEDISDSTDSELLPNNNEQTIPLTQLERQQNVQENEKTVLNKETSSSTKALTWDPDDCDAPAGQPICFFDSVSIIPLYVLEFFIMKLCWNVASGIFSFLILYMHVPGCYTMVAESKFMIKVEEFFNLFFSDNAVNFFESFHKRCGDKEVACQEEGVIVFRGLFLEFQDVNIFFSDIRCSSWHPHDKAGYAREVSFQHPIKLYLGAKYGTCQETQKFHIYRNSHLVVETSQEVKDVPYGDYFCVQRMGCCGLISGLFYKDCESGSLTDLEDAGYEFTFFCGLWDVERGVDDTKECSILRVYVNVAFSKKTMFKGKIEQSTIEECREAYTTLISIAHELLKQKNLEKQEEGILSTNLLQNEVVVPRKENGSVEPSERPIEESDVARNRQISTQSMDSCQESGSFHGNLLDTTSVAALFTALLKYFSNYRSRSRIYLPVVIPIAVLVLLQLYIIALSRIPPQVVVVSPADYMKGTGSMVGEKPEATAWLEKRVQHLRDEMIMIETRLEHMRHEHMLLKAQLKELDLLNKKS
ncbi:GRAM domain [Dillenia turbinata]|uniref:GRAM domain n=1 Tax=Dillenia turbinata TaxID=194707 RepID=A0AAN8V2T8_9MAGN